MEGYVRVSRVGGREGDSYISPAVQQEAIENYAKSHGIELVRIVKEEDVSGKKAVKDRALEALIKRCEEGASDGVIVNKLDRFARSIGETALAVDRLSAAGSRLIAVADNYDSADSANGQLILGVMSGIAAQYLETVKTNWSSSTKRAVSRGVHIASRAPVGYLRADQVKPEYDSRGNLIKDGRLVLDKNAAKHVHKAFELRAEGWSYQRIADYLTEQGVRPNLNAKEAETWQRWSKNAVIGILSNPAYLGAVRGPDASLRAGNGKRLVVNEGAHEAIVSPELFAAVQPRTGQYHERNGTLSGQALLAGVICCHACGHKLRVIGSTYKGERIANYSCVGRYSTGNCPAPASGKVKLVDEWVLSQLENHEATVGAAMVAMETRWLEAKAAVEQAEAELDGWVENPTLLTTLGPQRFEAGIVARQAALDEKRRTLWETPDPNIEGDARIVYIDGKPVIYETWDDMPITAKRRMLRRSIESVTLEKSDPKRRRWQPIGERIHVTFVGQSVRPDH
jgi:DNA invertase Pin-like site-specific DNA recombinase